MAPITAPADPVSRRGAVRAGGIIPLASEAELDAGQNPTHLEVVVAPGAEVSLVLTEDDGTGDGTGPAAATPITWEQATGVLTIGPVRGAVSAVPARRTWTLPDATLPAPDGAQRAEPAIRGRLA